MLSPVIPSPTWHFNFHPQPSVVPPLHLLYFSFTGRSMNSLSPLETFLLFTLPSCYLPWVSGFMHDCRRNRKAHCQGGGHFLINIGKQGVGSWYCGGNFHLRAELMPAWDLEIGDMDHTIANQELPLRGYDCLGTMRLWWKLKRIKKACWCILTCSLSLSSWFSVFSPTAP